MHKTWDVAVVGATGAVGAAMLEILAQREFPIGTVYPLASERSAGRQLTFSGRAISVGNLAEFDFSKVQIGLFSPGGKRLKSVCAYSHQNRLRGSRQHIPVSL